MLICFYFYCLCCCLKLLSSKCQIFSYTLFWNSCLKKKMCSEKISVSLHYLKRKLNFTIFSSLKCMKISNVSQICTELGKISFTSNLDTIYLVITEIMSSTKKYPPKNININIQSYFCISSSNKLFSLDISKVKIVCMICKG